MSMLIIKSWEELQAQVSNILVEINKDSILAVAAASNPIIALAELGYELDPSIVDNAEDRMRFKTRDVARLQKLRAEIFKLAGKTFQLRQPAELKVLMEGDLGLQAFDDQGCPINFPVAPYQKVNVGSQPEDPLKQYEGMHPVVEPILEFRKIDASVHSFCDATAYRKIREGKTTLGETLQIKARLKTEGDQKSAVKKSR